MPWHSRDVAPAHRCAPLHAITLRCGSSRAGSGRHGWAPRTRRRGDCLVTDGDATPGPSGGRYLTSTSAQSRNAPLGEPGSVVVVVGQSHVMPMLCSSVTVRHSTFSSLPQSASVEHRPRHWSVTVRKQREQGSVVVVVVVVVVGHGPFPHPQLQGGDPPVQLQRPALQSAMTCRMQVPRACPLSPLAATSSLQAR